MLGRLLCRLGLHSFGPPRGDGYARNRCHRCGEPWARHDPLACPTCPHPRDSHGAWGCTGMFCGCERTWIGGGWP
jgi:hypothetical protein